MQLEINRNWQQQANFFSNSTFETLRFITSSSIHISSLPSLSFSSSSPSSPPSPSTEASPTKTVTKVEELHDCCICLYAIAPRQPLFVSPCSHIFHYKCIRPLLQNHPGFQCPLCRTYADLEQDVAIEEEEVNAPRRIVSTCEARISGSEDQVQNSPQSVDDTFSQPSSPSFKNRRSFVIEKIRTAMCLDNKKPRSPDKTLSSPRLQDPENEIFMGTDTPAGPSSPSPTRVPQSISDGYPFPTVSRVQSPYAVNGAQPTTNVTLPLSTTSFLDTKDEEILPSPIEELGDPNDSAIKRVGGGGKGKERATDQVQDLLGIEAV